jgi:hypothetical protein
MGLVLGNAWDVLWHNMPGYAVDLACQIWKVQFMLPTKMKEKTHIYSW